MRPRWDNRTRRAIHPMKKAMRVEMAKARRRKRKVSLMENRPRLVGGGGGAAGEEEVRRWV